MTDKALVARPTMTPAEEAVWAERVKLPGAGVQSAAAEAGGSSKEEPPAQSVRRRVRTVRCAGQRSWGYPSTRSRNGPNTSARRRRDVAFSRKGERLVPGRNRQWRLSIRYLKGSSTSTP